jgi:Protein of unknown function (DUF3606)
MIVQPSHHCISLLNILELEYSIGVISRTLLSNAISRPIPYTSVFIDPMNYPQVEHWAHDMQVETYDLRAAIKVVGPRLSDLRRYFGRTAHVIFLEDRRAKSTGTAVSPCGLPA